MSKSRFIRIAAALQVAAYATQAGAQSAPSLKDVIDPHRAVYDISLSRADQGSGVSSAAGRMVFEVTGGSCAGYTMRQRMVVNIGDEEGNLGKLDFQISTYESASGDLYNFDARTTMNGQVVESVEGEARRRGSDIEVSLKQPRQKTVQLDGEVLFPSQHFQAILDAARADKNFLSVDVYEGTGAGESSDEAAAAIGGVSETRAGHPVGGGVRQWPVSVGYFDPEGASEQHAGEDLPTYQMSFTLYDNGVTGDLVMNYGDYALSGSLTEVERLSESDCLPR